MTTLFNPSSLCDLYDTKYNIYIVGKKLRLTNKGYAMGEQVKDY